MATLQIRSLDEHLYEALGHRAKQQNRSVSEEASSILREQLSQAARSQEAATDAFLKLAGSWQDDRESDEIIKDIRDARQSRKPPVLD